MAKAAKYDRNEENPLSCQRQDLCVTGTGIVFAALREVMICGSPEATAMPSRNRLYVVPPIVLQANRNAGPQIFEATGTGLTSNIHESIPAL
jgi:hypothetical protein